MGFKAFAPWLGKNTSSLSALKSRRMNAVFIAAGTHLDSLRSQSENKANKPEEARIQRTNDEKSQRPDQTMPEAVPSEILRHLR